MYHITILNKRKGEINIISFCFFKINFTIIKLTIKGTMISHSTLLYCLDIPNTIPISTNNITKADPP